MYVIDTTLGHGDYFNWLLDSAGLEIRRRFANRLVSVNKYSWQELGELHAFVAERDWATLSTNVEKLHHGNEREGLGSFLKEHLGKSILAAQGASQLAAIFVRAGIWEDNGKRWGMAFRVVKEDWQPLLRAHYRLLESLQARVFLGLDWDFYLNGVGQQLYYDVDGAMAEEEEGERAAWLTIFPEER